MFQLDQFSHLILSCNNFGWWRIWIGVYNVEMSQLKIIPVFFFSFQKGYLLIYFFIRIGRVDNFHSPYLNLKWPTLTHPPPSIVKRLAPTRHASPSGRSVRHFVFKWPRWRSTIFFELCHRQPNDDCNTKYHCQAPALFYFLLAKLCLVVQSLPSLPMMAALKVSDH